LKLIDLQIMANFDVAKAIFAQIDANHDGT